MRPIHSCRVARLLLALFLTPMAAWALRSPFRPETESFRPPDLAQFGEELTAAFDPSAIDGAFAQGAFLMTGLPLSDGRTVDVDLVQFSPFAADARIVAMTEKGPEEHPIPADRRYFKGSIPHRPDSAALFVFWKDGFSGFIDLDGWRFIYGTTRDQAGNLLSAVTKFDPTLQPENYHTCDNDLKQAQTELPPMPHDPAAAARIPSSGTLKAELALDMDYEAYTFFGSSVSNASNYATLLTAAISVFYERDANTIIAIKEITVWTSTAAPYPYTSTTTSALLDQIRTYYGTYKGGLTRASAHLLSKKSLGGGIGYLTDGGLLCNNSWAFAVDGINGTYSYPTAAYTWDADCFAHELGHNFGSKHTHCYYVVDHWLDCCYVESGCCPGPATSTRGTIMSYCHLQPAGKDLVFGSYVSPIIRTGAVNGSCVLESGSPGTIGGNAAYWASSGLKVNKQSSPIATSLILDNGTYNGAFGYTSTTLMAIINKFTPSVYPVTLNRIDIIFGNSTTLAAGRAIRLLVYKDAAGTGLPANSTLSYTQDTTIQVVSGSTWNSYTLTTPQTITSGDVYIGAYDLLADAGDTYFASLDSAGALSRSYYKANSTTPSGYSVYSRNFMIRAYGTRTPGGNDVLLSWGTPCNNATQPGQKYAVYQDALSQLAVEGYNPSPLDCAVDALNKTYYVTGNAYFTVVPVVGPNEGGHSFSRPTPTVHCQAVNPDPSCQ